AAAIHTTSAAAAPSDGIALEIAGTLVDDANSVDVYALSGMLLDIPLSSVLTDVYHTLRSKANPDLQFLGLAGLLRGPEGTSALAEIAAGVSRIPSLRTNIIRAISGVRNTDPAAIRSLGVIASSPNVSCQRSAAEALQRIHTRGTLPYLVQLLSS